MKNNQKSSKTNCKKQQQTVGQTHDSGRSMVEMLGVLAVVGVLSIAGIMGYSYAMKKYQANKVAAELNLLSNQMAMIMEQPHDGDFELSLGEPYDNGTLTSGAYAFSYGCGTDSTVKETCAEDEYAYYARLENVPEELCQTLAQTTQFLSYLTEQQVNGEIDTTGAHCIESETGNALVLFFETQEEDEWEDEVLTSNAEENEEKSTTPESTTTMMTTTTTVSGLDGYFWGTLNGTNQDVACSYMGTSSLGYDTPYATAEECDKCDNTDYKRVLGAYGRCFRCDKAVISDQKDNIRNVCRKCGRGVRWVIYPTDPMYRDDYYLCAPGSDDIGEQPFFAESITTITMTETMTEISTTPETTSSMSTFSPAITVSGLDGYFMGRLDDGSKPLTSISCDFVNQSSHGYDAPQTTVSECNKCDNTDYKRVFVWSGRCLRCDSTVISDSKDNIQSVCKKCGRGVDWTQPDMIICAPGADDIGTEN